MSRIDEIANRMNAVKVRIANDQPVSDQPTWADVQHLLSCIEGRGVADDDGTCAKCERINDRIEAALSIARANAIDEAIVIARSLKRDRRSAGDDEEFGHDNACDEIVAALEALKQKGN